MARVRWTVRGTLNVRHMFNETRNRYGNTSPLEDVQVRISGRSRVAGRWGPWGRWGEVRTDRRGRFALTAPSTEGSDGYAFRFVSGATTSSCMATTQGR
jgi:hypothetical protein